MSNVHIMIDLETMATSKDAAIVAIGAVAIRTDGHVEATLYEAVSLESSVKHGGTISPNTVMWWLQQSKSAQQALYERPALHILEALTSLAAFIRSFPSCQVWSNAASFDLTILEGYYARVGATLPWSYRDAMCYRTLKNLCPDVAIVRSGDQHNALDDALSQAYHLVEMLRSLRSM